MVDIRRGWVADGLLLSIVHLHALTNDHSLNLLRPVAPLCNVESLAVILRVDMWLLRSCWCLGHLGKPILHVKLTHVKDAIPSSVLVCSSSACCHTSLDSPLIIHLDSREKATRLGVCLLLDNLRYSSSWLSFSRLWTSWDNILSLFVLVNHNLSGYTNLAILRLIYWHVIPSSSKWHRCLNSYFGSYSPINTHFFVYLSWEFFKFLGQLSRLSLGCFKLICYNLVILDAIYLISDVKHLFLFFMKRFTLFWNDLKSVMVFNLRKGYCLGKLLLYITLR